MTQKTKIFAVTDNRFIHDEFKKIFDEQNINVHFFCSPKSQELFKAELKSGSMRTINMKTEAESLISPYDCGFSCHSKQIFPKKLVNALLCVNIHPGYNPHNRGWFPQVFSILNKKPAGITIHVMDEEIDHGDIIAQQQIDITNYDTSLTAYNRMLDAEIKLFKEILPSIINRTFEAKKPTQTGNYNSITDYKKLCEIDLNKTLTMREAIDYLRAMTHPPYKNAYYYDESGNKVKIWLDIDIEKIEKE